LTNRGRRLIVHWGLGLVGVVVATVSALMLGQRAIFLIGPLAVSGYLVGLLLGELMMPHAPSGLVRRVSLDRRSFDRYMGAGWVWAWRAAAGASLTAIAAAGLIGGADGRSLTVACSDGTTNTASPWPGWSFGAPALVALLLGIFLVEVSMRRIVERPRPDPKLMDVAADEANRTASMRRAVAAGMAISLVPLAGVCLSAALILAFMCSAPGTLAWNGPVAAALAILGCAAGTGAVAGLAALVRIDASTAAATAHGQRS
jgi:MFS family permease